MPINKRIALVWGGDDYDVVITMETIDRIEEHLNILQMIGRMISDPLDIRDGQSSRIISILLTSAGCIVSQEDVYCEIFGNGKITRDEANEIMWKIIPCLYPETKKKPKAEVKKGKKSPRSRTKSSTK